MSLTPKQEKFCLAYLETGNASEAYRRAYSAQNMKPESIAVAASRVLGNAKVALRLAELRERSESAAVMGRQEALERLSMMARTSLADLVEFGSYELGEDENGLPIVQAAWKIKDSALQDPKQLAAIAELSASKDGIKIKTHSPLQAIQQLAKMQGWDRPDLDLDMEAKRLAVDKLRKELQGGGSGDSLASVLSELIAKLPG
ncbi:terminase small subunit [Azotobacter chroococcum]|nr:terminase small subunit [Azotobacter chroococcum]